MQGSIIFGMHRRSVLSRVERLSAKMVSTFRPSITTTLGEKSIDDS